MASNSYNFGFIKGHMKIKPSLLLISFVDHFIVGISPFVVNKIPPPTRSLCGNSFMNRVCFLLLLELRVLCVGPRRSRIYQSEVSTSISAKTKIRNQASLLWLQGFGSESREALARSHWDSRWPWRPPPGPFAAMARNEEKAMAALNRWTAQKRDIEMQKNMGALAIPA